jgi:ribose transport system ATP-binding protein
MNENPTKTTLLEATGVTKRFGHTVALSDGSLEVASGEIHGLLGANGAGKSTLVKILAGVVQRDSGRIRIGGVELGESVHPREIKDLGVSFIHQDLGLIEEMTVAENIAMGLGFPNRLGVINPSRLRKQAREHLDELGVDLDPESELSELNGADQALVAIARAVVHGAKLIVLDEPTARLRGPEVNRLFEQLDALRSKSVGFIYVTHRLDEVFNMTDRVTVLRNGGTVMTSRTSDLTEDELISEIVGSAWTSAAVEIKAPPARESEAVLNIKNLTTSELEDFSLEIGPGEIVGVTGPAGAGSSLVRTIAGAEEPLSGEIKLFGDNRARSSREAVSERIAYIPADRRREGLALELSIRENLAYSHSIQTEGNARSGPGRWFRSAPRKRERTLVGDLIERFQIRAQSGESLVSELSGGNQQKVLLAKWLQEEPRLLMLDEPTQGVDVRTRREIYTMVAELAGRGMPLIVVSADFQELEELCHRVVVIRDRRSGIELTGDDVTQDRIAIESYRVGKDAVDTHLQETHETERRVQ